MATAARFKDSLPSYYSQSARRKSGSTLCSEVATTPPSHVVAGNVPVTAHPFESNAPPSPPPTPSSPSAIVARPARKEPRPQVVSRPARPTRPSLSDQLATIGLQADSVVQSLTKPAAPSSKPTSNFTVPTLSMVVGRLECKFPSPATFSATECHYQFLHGTRDIAMHMYYRDMTEVVFDKRALTLRFKIPHPLAEFGADYDYRNRSHGVAIGLASVADWTRARALVLANVLK